MKVLHLPTSYRGFDALDFAAEATTGKGKKPKPTDYRCCLCGKPFYGYGNNPAPLTNDVRMRCCDECDRKYVIPERMRQGAY